MMKSLFILSDFGLSDTYVGQMKAAVLSQSMENISIIDLTHDVRAGSITEGAFHLSISRKVIQPGSVIVAVVDPGVGTRRHGVVCEVDGAFYVGPDNGLFGLLPVCRAWKLPDPPAESSSTFHGRDVFAPAGARLMMDPGWVDTLEPVPTNELIPLPLEMPVSDDDGLKVSVAHIDRFGNVILWLYPGYHPSLLQLPDGRVMHLTEAATYAEHSGILYLEGSQGLMEIAINGESASENLGVTAGDRILLRKAIDEIH